MADNAVEFTYDDLQFVRVNPLQPVDLDQLAQYDAIILDYTGEYNTYRFLRRVRIHDEKDIYLKPVFLYKIHGGADTVTSKLADGITNNLSNPDSVAAITREINKRIY